MSCTLSGAINDSQNKVWGFIPHITGNNLVKRTFHLYQISGIVTLIRVLIAMSFPSYRGVIMRVLRLAILGKPTLI
jgi:hypothetical protein